MRSGLACFLTALALQVATPSAQPTMNEAANYNSTGTDRQLRGTLMTPSKFDEYVFAMFWWPGQCRSTQGIPKCQPAQMPPAWRQQLVVHGLWPTYSTKLKQQPPARPDGLSQWQPTGVPGHPQATPQTAADRLVFAGQGVSNSNPDFYQYEYNTHGKCAEIGQAAYFAKAVQLGRQAIGRFPNPVTNTVPAARLQTALAGGLLPLNHVRLECRNGGANNGGQYLESVEFCYKRTPEINTPTPCQRASSCGTGNVRLLF